MEQHFIDNLYFYDYDFMTSFIHYDIFFLSISAPGYDWLTDIDLVIGVKLELALFISE